MVLALGFAFAQPEPFMDLYTYLWTIYPATGGIGLRHDRWAGYTSRRAVMPTLNRPRTSTYCITCRLNSHRKGNFFERKKKKQKKIIRSNYRLCSGEVEHLCICHSCPSSFPRPRRRSRTYFPLKTWGSRRRREGSRAHWDQRQCYWSRWS